MHKFKIIVLFAIIFCFIFPTGCWDLTDINDHIFILGLGIDSSNEEGLYRFTFHYANPRGEQSDQSSDKMTYINSTIESYSLPLAMRELIRNSDSEANFEHLQSLVLGSDYLEQLSFDDIDMLFRIASVRRKCVVVTTDIKASDILSMKFSSASTAVMINRLSNHYSSSDNNVLSGYSLTSLYTKKIDDLSFCLFSIDAVDNKNYTVISPADAADNKNLSLAVTGLSVFRNCKYVGSLGYTELETIRLLTNNQTEGLLNVINEDSTNSYYQVLSSDCSKSCKIMNNTPVFTINLSLDCLLISTEANASTSRKIEKSLLDEIEHLVTLGKYKYGGEILGLETALRQDCRDWYDNNTGYMENSFADADINIYVNCKIASSGIIE